MEEFLRMKEESNDILAHLNGACITIVPSPIDLKVCYSFNQQDQTVTVTVYLAGVSMGTATLSASHPRVKFSLSLAVVKASIELTLDLPNTSLDYEAKACFWSPFSWHCASHSGKISIS